MSATIYRKAKTELVPSDNWQEMKGHMIHVLITKEDDTTFNAIALNLPGAASSGETEEEAKENIKEAVAGLFESYKESGDAIPWKDSTSAKIPFGARSMRIFVYA